MPSEDQRLFVFTPAPDTLDGERLERLRALAREQLTSVARR
ncbi:hypothetical protein [Actinomadura sp. HBU206391]|nr:hypothetical protein [Actinomadura sp. HBU206391]